MLTIPVVGDTKVVTRDIVTTHGTISKGSSVRIVGRMLALYTICDEQQNIMAHDLRAVTEEGPLFEE